MKKIVHVMLENFYKNGFGYQENILPVKHQQLGYKVDIITYNKGGEASYYDAPAPCMYLNPDNIPVHVLALNESLLCKIPFVKLFVNVTKGFYEKLEELNPDIIFMHGINLQDNLEVIRFLKKHRNTKLFVDNHSDYYNTPVDNFKAKVLQRFSGGIKGRKLGKIAERVWGVTPWRVIYQQEIYKVPKEKSGLLVMGGDESKIDWDNRLEIRKSIRGKFNIPLDATLVVTGGKIDRTKNIHNLIDAVLDINRNDIHLLIFGRVEKDMEEYFAKITPNSQIHNVGWIPADNAYEMFLASDLAIFPGTHSVLWEQACACGLPGIYKDWDGGFNHVDLKGNCILLQDVSSNNIKQTIAKLVNDDALFRKMKSIAESRCRKEFSYIDIAKKAIGLKANNTSSK